MKNKLGFFLVTVMAIAFFSACQDTVTYAEQKAKERENIDNYIKANDITVITLDEFLKDTVTNNPESGPDFKKNEFVLFPESGVYMQIVRRGTGKPLLAGEKKLYNCRFMEYDIANADTLTTNLFGTDPDVMSCSRVSDTYSATFTQGVMSRAYGNSVPAGWLVPMPYLRPGFYNGAPSAKVRLIVPHDKGNSSAMQSVFACYYEITLMSQKWQ